MHIAVIDDQAATREATVKLIRQLAQPSQPLQVAAYSNAEQFLFAEKSADLLLLDIKLGSGMDGMALAKKFANMIPKPPSLLSVTTTNSCSMVTM
ncbi:response regulator [Lacticaseibacillus rhamnosus]